MKHVFMLFSAESPIMYDGVSGQGGGQAIDLFRFEAEEEEPLPLRILLKRVARSPNGRQ